MEAKERKRFREPPQDLGSFMKIWAPLAHKDGARPEKDLMAAVLADAVWDYRRYAGSNHRFFREVKDWLFADDDRQLFSFISICAMLELNPAAIRRELLTWSRRAS